MKYDPIMCMMVDDSVKTKDANKYVEKAIQLIKEGKGSLAILSTLKEMGLTPSDANSYYAEARSQTGYRNNDSNTIDKAIKMCDYAYGTAEIKDVNGKWVVYHDGKYVQEFTNSDDAEAFVREKGWH